MRPVMIALLSALTLLAIAGESQAQYRGFRGRVVRRSTFPPNRMPGWDWWRIYPWSPYNYGRNPYNPMVYPYVDSYPIYSPYSVGGDYPPPVYGQPAYGSTESSEPLYLPNPTGPGAVPPPDGALIRLFIPDRFGEVYFDDVKTSSIGTTRYYVTPTLPGDKPLSYQVKASFRRDGETVSEERTVKVSPGKTVIVDFDKPVGAKSGE
jgi:uncharacterized protein (TIGR03000 family)